MSVISKKIFNLIPKNNLIEIDTTDDIEHIVKKVFFSNKDLSTTVTSDIKFKGCDFRVIDFTKSKLLRTDFEECTFKDVNFSNSDLHSIKFIRCKFENVNFTESRLSHIGYWFCNLAFVLFKKSYLVFNIFTTCNLYNLDFTDFITLKSCDFRYTSMDEVKGLLDAFTFIKENFEIKEDSSGNFLGFYGYTDKTNLLGTDILESYPHPLGEKRFNKVIKNRITKSFVDYNKNNEWGCGIKLVPTKKNKDMFKVEVSYEDLLTVVVPYVIDDCIRVGTCKVVQENSR